MTRWEVRFKNYYIPGSYRWETMKVFTNPGDADEWLMAYIRSNKYPNDDFTIRKVTD